MTRGLYISGTGMMLQRRLMENITNNIANADTTGYKKEHLVSHTFDEVLINRMGDPRVVGQTVVPIHWHITQFPHTTSARDDEGGKTFNPVGPLALGTQIDQLYINFDTGILEGTERTTDMALIGDVFFVMQTPDGERYTRSGAFYIDELGYLTDGEGNYLLGENGPIYVGGLDFTIDDTGGVWLDGEYADRIRVASFEDNDVLRKQGSNLFYALEDPLDAPNPYRIRQGFLEGSNVDIGREMVDMLTVFRTYETNQRMLTMIDETIGKAVN
jgi:flagellar basal-body rod protein FlgG